MIISEQTVARIGRRMKTSLNTLLFSSPSARGRCRRARGRRALGHYWRAVSQQLNPAGDQPIASLQPRHDEVVVADDGADDNRALPRH
jgi:hypothetical protein